MNEVKENRSLKNKLSFKLMLLLSVLVLLGVVFIVIRLEVFWGEQPSKDYELWRITYYLRFFPGEEPTRVQIVLPYQTGQYEVISENLSYSNLDIEMRTRPDAGQRKLVGKPRNRDRKVTFNAQFSLRVPGERSETELTGEQIKRLFPEYDTESVFTVTNARKLKTSIEAMKKIPPLNRYSSREDHGLLFTLMDLTRLSARMEQVLVVLLLMPLGALITSVIHNIFRWKTFSHFTPTLLAISFMHARLLPGLIIFSTIFLVGFSLRLVVDNLKLSMRPRVSMVLLSICLTLALTVSVSDYLGISPGSGGILLPMIAITLLIERFFRNIIKRGYPVAVKKFTGTMVAAICSLLIFQVEEIHWVLLNFPEAEFFIAAVLILVGLYRVKENNHANND